MTADAFFDEVLTVREVFALADDDGVPVATGPSGERAMPFWSRRSRAERVRSTAAAYRPLRVVGVPLDRWAAQWLDGLEADGLRVGLNWSGAHPAGDALTPQEVRHRLLPPG